MNGDAIKSASQATTNVTSAGAATAMWRRSATSYAGMKRSRKASASSVSGCSGCPYRSHVTPMEPAYVPAANPTAPAVHFSAVRNLCVVLIALCRLGYRSRRMRSRLTAQEHHRQHRCPEQVTENVDALEESHPRRRLVSDHSGNVPAGQRAEGDADQK